MKNLFDYRPRMTKSEASKLFVDHYESLIQAGMEFDEDNLRACWAEAERISL
jgi:hypothetical protein